MSLPDGSRLLHIGPHKTGTTTLQAALHQNREALAAQGVHYVGRKKHSMAAAMAAATGGRLATASGSEPGAAKWAGLVREARTSTARVRVLSSEFYSDAPPERIPAILDDLGPEETHVVVTLRPLVRILASQWQQFMQNGPVMRYDNRRGYQDWLAEILAGEDAGTPAFWRRHRHDRLVETWADVVGADGMTIVVVDDRDKRMLMRSFEDLLGVRDGTLVPREVSANRSLTYPEVELLRAFNQRWLDAGLSAADYTYLVRFGAARFLQERKPEPDEERLLTPPWAVTRAAELGREMAGRIRDTGVPVVGDLDLLGEEGIAVGVGENQPLDAVPAPVAARFAAGLVTMLDRLPARPAPEHRTAGPLERVVRADKTVRAAGGGEALERRSAHLARELQAVRTVDATSRLRLLRVVAGRVRRRLGARLRGDQRG